MFIVFVFFSSHYFPSGLLLVLLPNLKKIPKRKKWLHGCAARIVECTGSKQLLQYYHPQKPTMEKCWAKTIC
jgi:hypothetical protein